jgi:hypothetical protein
MAQQWSQRGLHRFFIGENGKFDAAAKNRPGIIDLVLARKDGAVIDWHDCVYDQTIRGTKERIAILTAGELAPGYNDKLQKLNWDDLFDKHNLGLYLEDLRSGWIDEYDLILVDSRTGVSDVGGICTVLLPDALIALFTTTWQSVNGTVSTVKWARERRALLPVDRARLLVVPVPARDEGQAEHKRTLHWRGIYAREFADLYSDWIPKLMQAADMVNKLYVPYVAIWSFGESLPVVEENSRSPDPRSISAAYTTLAKLLKAKLNWLEIEAETSLQLALTQRTLAAERKKWRLISIALIVALSLAFGIATLFLVSYFRDIELRQAAEKSRDAVTKSQSLITKLMSETDAKAAEQELEEFKSLAGEDSPVYLKQEERVADLLRKNGDFELAAGHFEHLYFKTYGSNDVQFAEAAGDMYLAAGSALSAAQWYGFAIQHAGENASGELTTRFVQASLLAAKDSGAKAELDDVATKIGEQRLETSLIDMTHSPQPYAVPDRLLVEAFEYLANLYESKKQEPGDKFWESYASAADAAGDKATAAKVRAKVVPVDQSKH